MYVKDYVELTAGTTVLLAGDTNYVPITVFSSAGLLDLHAVLQLPQNRLSNVWLQPLIPETASATMQAAGANTSMLTFTAMPGQTLLGTQQLARLHFTAVPGQDSAFIPLHLSSMNVGMADEGADPTFLVNDGRVTVVGQRPLLESRVTASNQREVVLYGKRNTTYIIEFSTSLTNGARWATRGTIFSAAMTNLSQSLILNQPAPPVFYRARQQ
jgi:hypothetical protein